MRLLLTFTLCLLAAFAHGQAYDAMSRSTNAIGTDLIAVQTNSAGLSGQKFLTTMTLDNFLSTLAGLDGWSAVAGGTATNAQPPSTTLTNLSGTGAITNLNQGAIFYISTTGNNTTAQEGRPDKPWRNITNAAYQTSFGDAVYVHSGTYFIPTNQASIFRTGVDWYFEAGVTINVGTAGDSASFGHLIHDEAGPITNRVYGWPTIVQSNDLGSVIYVTNRSDLVVYAHKLRNANQEAPVKRGAGVNLRIIDFDEISSDGYDGYIDEANPNTGKLVLIGNRIVGDTQNGDSALEFTAGFANPGDGYVKLNYARGDFNLVDNLVAEIGALELGANNRIYASTNQLGTGILRNSYVYGSSNSSVSLIDIPAGSFHTAGTFENVVFRGATNRPIANITNCCGSQIKFIDCRFEDGSGATNSIRANNSQTVFLSNVKMDLGLHANVTAGTVTNYHSVIRAGNVQNAGTTTNTGTLDQRGLATFYEGVNVSADINLISGSSIIGSSGSTITADVYAGDGSGLTLDASGFNGNLTTSDNTLQEIAQKLDDLVGGGGGEANVNGEAAVTNATRFGLVNGKAGVTNLLRSIEPMYGMKGTNQGGTNIQTAVDHAVIPNHTQLNTVSNYLWGQKQDISVLLGSIAALGNGIVAVIDSGTGDAAARTITGTASEITVADGNGVSGNPTISLPSLVNLGANSSLTTSTGNVQRLHATNDVTVGTDGSSAGNVFLTATNGVAGLGQTVPGTLTTTNTIQWTLGVPAANDIFYVASVSGQTAVVTNGLPSTVVTIAGAQTITGAKTVGTINSTTNLNVNAEVVTNSTTRLAAGVSGVGGANTNFTFDAKSKQFIYTDAGTTNHNVVAIMNWSTDAHDNIVNIATNRTATARTYSFGTTTNNLIPVGSLSFPLQVTNALYVAYSQRGSNTFYAARYIALPAP